jgi:zinc transporter ZupT
MEFGRTRAMVLAIAAGSSSLLGLAAVLALGEANPHWIGWLLPFSAGSFVYISLFDLLPETLGGRSGKQKLAQLAALAAGALLAIALTALPGA